MKNLNDAIKVYLSPILNEYIDEYLTSKFKPLYEQITYDLNSQIKGFLKEIEKVKNSCIDYLKNEREKIFSEVRPFNADITNIVSRLNQIEEMIRSHALGVTNVYKEIKDLKKSQAKNSERIAVIDDIVDGDSRIAQNIFIELEDIRKIINKSKTVGEKKVVNSSVVKPKTMIKSVLDQKPKGASHGRDKTRRIGKNKD